MRFLFPRAGPRATQFEWAIVVFLTGCVFEPPRGRPPEVIGQDAAGEPPVDAAEPSVDAAEPPAPDAAGADAEEPDASPITTCGDGRIEAPESCDDANALPGDGCDETCTVEPGFICASIPSRCAPAEETVLVDAAGASCPGDAGSGVAGDPYCSLAQAVSAGAPIVVIRSGLYRGPVVIAGGNVEVIADPGAVLEGGASIALKIEGGATASIIGLTVRSEGADALEIGQAGTRATIRSCTLGPSRGLGADVKNGTMVTFERNRVERNRAGGLKIDTPGARLVNNVVHGNGPGSELGGVYFKRGPATFANNTVAFNTASSGVAGIRCDAEVSIINTIVWDNFRGEEPSSLSSACAASHSDVGPGDGPGGSNVELDPSFEPGGTFHLQPGSPLIDAGDPAGIESIGGPAPGDDFDGELRPIGNGVDIGADEAG